MVGRKKKNNTDPALQTTNVNVTPGTGEIRFWKETFAPEWIDEAKREAAVQGYQARRREIVFAQCFVESYLFEWIRDKVVKGAFGKIPNYSTKGRGIRNRWMGAVNKVCQERSIAPPSWDARYWTDFSRLVCYRNGLVHGKASWPTLISQPTIRVGPRPEPSKETLEKLPPGWAVEIVVELVRQLHKTLGTPAPSWL